VPEEEVSVQIRPYDAHFFTAPPIGLKPSPILSSDKTRYSNPPLTVPNRSVERESADCAFDWVWLLHDGLL